MSGPTYDSAAWRRRVIGISKARLSPDRKLVVLALETFADYRKGTNAHPGEEALAEMCNLTTRAVRDALAAGRRLGLVERTALANPKQGKADVYRMAITGTAVPVEGGHHRNGHDVTTGTATTSPPEPPFRPPTQVPTQVPKRGLRQSGTSPHAGTGDDPPPNGKRRTANSEQAAPATASPAVAALPAPPRFWPEKFPDPEPPRGCAEHPLNDGGPCNHCQTANEMHKQWQQDARTWRADRAAANTAWINACDECGDPPGWLLAADGTPVEPLDKCQHPTLIAAWRDHRSATRCDEHRSRRRPAAPSDCPDCATKERRAS